MSDRGRSGRSMGTCERGRAHQGKDVVRMEKDHLGRKDYPWCSQGRDTDRPVWAVLCCCSQTWEGAEESRVIGRACCDQIYVFGYLSWVQKTYRELLKNTVVCFVRRWECLNWLWLLKVPVSAERGMEGTWEEQMWAYSLGICPMIQVDRWPSSQSCQAMVGAMTRKRW